jgi:2-polyprenyl-3-methyl-5-hydroxy-6-metoxy-1,4-benzoquinol methylase
MQQTEKHFDHYPIKHSKYSSHYYLRQMVGEGNDVLDIGCGEGYFASTIADHNRIFGIDILEQPKQMKAFKGYVKADLEDGLKDAQEQLKGRQFDRVLLPDVLEHVRFPERLLSDCYRVLKSQGLLIVSVPNVANITVRLSLLMGHWDYTERGILDNTHYRFYTHATARRLLEDNGYQVEKRVTTVMPIELALGFPHNNPVVVFMNRILAFFTVLMPNLFGFQCMFVARKKPNTEKE